MLPCGSTAASRSLETTAAYSPWGDQLACDQEPRCRSEPSAAAVQVPPGPDTSSRPGEGSEDSIGAEWRTPSALVIKPPTLAPAGESTRPAATEASTGTRASRRCERLLTTGSRAAYAACTTLQA